jgi:hypothetical protein
MRQTVHGTDFRAYPRDRCGHCRRVAHIAGRFELRADSCSAASFTSIKATRQPFSARRCAISCSIPLPAPVTMAVLPCTVAPFTFFWIIADRWPGNSWIARRSLTLIHSSEVAQEFLHHITNDGEKPSLSRGFL